MNQTLFLGILSTCLTGLGVRAELCVLSAVSPRLGGALRAVTHGPAVESVFPAVGKEHPLWTVPLGFFVSASGPQTRYSGPLLRN